MVMIEVEEAGWYVGSKGERMRGTLRGNENEIRKYLVCTQI
jgi:hypothetical protein